MKEEKCRLDSLTCLSGCLGSRPDPLPPLGTGSSSQFPGGLVTPSPCRGKFGKEGVGET